MISTNGHHAHCAGLLENNIWGKLRGRTGWKANGTSLLSNQYIFDCCQTFGHLHRSVYFWAVFNGDNKQNRVTNFEGVFRDADVLASYCNCGWNFDPPSATKDQSKQWTPSDKVMVTVFWDAHGVIPIDYLEAERSPDNVIWTCLSDLTVIWSRNDRTCRRKKIFSTRTRHRRTKEQWSWQHFTKRWVSHPYSAD